MSRPEEVFDGVLHGHDVLLCEVLGTDDGAFQRCDTEVEEVVAVRPRDLCCILIVVLTKEQLQDGLEKQRIQLDRNVDEY